MTIFLKVALITILIVSSGNKAHALVQEINYGKVFCSMMDGENSIEPSSIDEYFSLNSNQDKKSIFYNFISTSHCEGYELLFNKFPLQLVKLKINDKENHYISFEIDKNNKIVNLYIYFGDKNKFEIKYHAVKMRDGKLLTTFFVGSPEAKRTVFLRTPYLNLSTTTFFRENYMEYVRFDVNIVIQANRGSFQSEGSFRWLHRENINDAKDTIDWIVKQKFNNGKVIPSGGSYAGFNALATAATNHPAIDFTISCSSPSNASTDSLSSTQSMRESYLNFVNERETSITTRGMIDKILSLQSQKNTKLHDVDLLLFERKLVDWQEFLKSYDNSDGTYWSNRSILADIKNVNKPIFHIAGLQNDQDSRDTILTFKSIQDSSKDQYLYLHPGGHGCGDFLKSELFHNALTNTLDHSTSKKVLHYSINSSGYVLRDKYSGTLNEWLKVPLSFDKERLSQSDDNERVLRLLDYNGDTIKENSNVSLRYVTTKRIYLNGSISLKLNINNRLRNTSILTKLIIYRPDGRSISVHNATPGVYFSDNDFGKKMTVDIEYSPAIAILPRGSLIELRVTASPAFEFNFNKKENEEFYLENLQSKYGHIDILETPAPILSIPKE